MAADGQGLEGAEEGVPADGVIDHLAALALGDLSDPLDEILLRIDDGIGAAMARAMRAFSMLPTVPMTVAPSALRPLAEQLADAAGRGVDQDMVAFPHPVDAMQQELRRSCPSA